jgi:hypothetical protein
VQLCVDHKKTSYLPAQSIVYSWIASKQKKQKKNEKKQKKALPPVLVAVLVVVGLEQNRRTQQLV